MTGVQYFPQIMAPNTVVAQLGLIPSPAQAVPIADLYAAMQAGTFVLISGNAYTATATDTVIYTNKTAAMPTAIQLPSVLLRKGKSLRYFDYSGNSGVITFTPAGSEKINGLSSWSIPSGASVTFIPIAGLGWLVDAPLSNAGNVGTGLLDFGAAMKPDTSLVITGQGNIVAGSAVEAWIICTATADHSADEHWLDAPRVYAGNISPGVGFTIYGSAPPGFGNDIQPYGKWSVAWRWN